MSAELDFLSICTKVGFMYKVKLICLFRKPDTLKNLTWMAIQRDAMLFESNSYLINMYDWV
jgi:hypothetical protein